jgi:anti-sigma factor RsiW
MKRLDSQNLQQYVDGELDQGRRKAVEAALKEDAAAQKKVRTLERMGELLRTELTAEIEAHPPQEMWPAIAQAIAQEKKDPRRATKSSLWQRFKDWREISARPLWPPLTAAAAAAVVAVIIALVWSHAKDPDPANKKRPERRGPKSNNLVVESMDYSGQPPTLFQIPDTDGEGTTTVIWVSPAAGEAKDRDSRTGPNANSNPSPSANPNPNPNSNPNANANPTPHPHRNAPSSGDSI